MSRKYKVYDQNYPHFVTSSVINWIDIFTRRIYFDVIIDSLSYCRAEKGMLLFAYCIMTNHIHLIIGSKQNQNIQESRKDWILKMMYEAGRLKSTNKNYQFWQHHYHPVQLDSDKMMGQKLDYIHNNPVKAGFVDKPEDYLYSSAKNYAGLQAVIDIDC